MNKYLLSTAAFIAATAVNAADVPSKSVPLPPTNPTTVASTTYFAGVHIGSNASINQDLWYGSLRGAVRGGWEFSEYARVEGNYDFAWSERSADRSHTVTTNLIGQYKIGYVPVTPYVLAGVGYRWTGVKDEPVYNVGAGVRYDITSNIEVDGRYRYITDKDRKRDSNVVSIGANYKF
jgi:hypothetical protein